MKGYVHVSAYVCRPTYSSMHVKCVSPHYLMWGIVDYKLLYVNSGLGLWGRGQNDWHPHCSSNLCRGWTARLSAADLTGPGWWSLIPSQLGNKKRAFWDCVCVCVCEWERKNKCLVSKALCVYGSEKDKDKEFVFRICLFLCEKGEQSAWWVNPCVRGQGANKESVFRMCLCAYMCAL